MTRHWIEAYFRRPEHLAFEGKPVVIIFSPQRLTEDLGADGVKRAFEAMRVECTRAGFKGLHLIACVADAGGARQAATEGYDAVSAYNWPGLGMQGEGMFAPFETLVDGFRRNWEHLLTQTQIPLNPLPLCGGWDSRPWHGENNLVRFGRTPELFQRHLLDAKRLLDSQPQKPDAPKSVIVEAWNEWGEGSYIEPHAQFGFGYLDALRRVFTASTNVHEDLTPADVGLGPYDVPVVPLRTAWDFSRDDQGWANIMQMADLKVAGGSLTARTIGNDPAFFGPPMEAQAGEFSAVSLRMRLSPPAGAPPTDSAQIFWRTTRLPEGEASSLRFAVQCDGQWHNYRLPIRQNPRWRGLVTRLRLDPCSQSNVRLELASIQLTR